MLKNRYNITYRPIKHDGVKNTDNKPYLYYDVVIENWFSNQRKGETFAGFRAKVGDAVRNFRWDRIESIIAN